MEQTAAADGTEKWRPKYNPWWICLAVMSATIMEILDTTITNVAMPHIAGSLAVTTHEATWVLTSYLVSNAIILPSTAWFSGFFGRKRFFMTCIILFTVASLLCGFANSLGFLLLARVFQGLGGGALMPISQAILLESFPKEKHGTAMAVFAIGVVIAPILGPLIGGWLTDNFSWRWVFFINLPTGIFALLLTNMFIEDPPYVKKESTMIDRIGFALMAIGLGTLQVVLDKGQEVDWLQSAWLCRLSIVTVVSLTAFIFWELRVKNPVVNLRILKDRNFSGGLVEALFLGAIMYGVLTLVPLFYQTLLGYTAYSSGLVFATFGIGCLIGSVAAGFLTNHFDGRIPFAMGLVVVSIGIFSLGIINLQMAMYSRFLSNVISGFGFMTAFIPLSVIAVGHLNNKDMGNGTGLFNLMRNIGGSIGIAITTTMLSRMGQVHQTFLTGRLTPYDPVYQQTVRAAGPEIANGLIYKGLLQQSSLLAYIDVFRFFGVVAVICVFLTVIFRRVKNAGTVMVH
jgi:DHA2 family multidrug resistance protein